MHKQTLKITCCVLFYVAVPSVGAVHGQRVYQVADGGNDRSDGTQRTYSFMKKSKFTEAQIVFAIKQSETGVAISEICRKMGISEATFYNWKKKFGGLGATELRRLRQLEDENSKLKQIVADLSLDKQMLQDV
jgi:putative transposase